MLGNTALGVNSEEEYFQKFSNIEFLGTNLIKIQNTVKNPSNCARGLLNIKKI